jgi:RNA polymerase sigma factor (sigma-70 family)
VLAAGGGASPAARAALDSLCQTYWYPLYAYVRRSGRDAEEAKDLTQEFFVGFLARNTVSFADPARGRFRTFLLTAMKHFLANEWKKENRLKRGGGQPALSLDTAEGEAQFTAEPADAATPEVLYERRWAAALLERVLRALEDESHAAGKGELFAALKASLWGGSRAATHAEAAARLGMSEGAFKVAAHRLRARYRELLRAEVAHTVSSLGEVDEELRHLVAVMSG